MNKKEIKKAADKINYFFSLWEKNRAKKIHEQEQEWRSTVEALREESRKAKEKAQQRFRQDVEERRRKDWIRRY